MLEAHKKEFPEFEEDESVCSLYSQHLNQHQLDWWQRVVVASCHHLNKASFSEAELQTRFNRDGLLPKGLGQVLDSMRSQGKVLRYNEFLQSCTPQSLSGWLWDRLGWVGRDENPTMVCLETLNRKAVDLLAKLPSLLQDSDGIVPMSLVEPISDELDLVLPLLSKMGRAAQIIYNNEKYLKYGTKVVVTDTDRCIVSLKSTDSILAKQENQLQREIERIKGQILAHKTQQQIALPLVKRLRAYSNNLSKKLSYRNNITSLLLSLHESRTQQEVLNALKIGAQELEHQNAQIDIVSLDDISRLSGLMLEQEDISKCLSTLPDSIEFDEAELERELKELISEKPVEITMPLINDQEIFVSSVDTTTMAEPEEYGLSGSPILV